MNAINKPTEAPAELSDRTLIALELRIARRADELVRDGLPLRHRDLECWIQAEGEVLPDWMSRPRR